MTPRFHKQCTLTTGRRAPRSRRQIRTFERAALAHHRAGRLTDDRFQALMVLPSWLNLRGGRCDPSHATIAAKANTCPRTVQRALEDARRLGLVTWDQRATRRDGETVQITNQYVLLPGLAAPTDAPPVDRPPQEQPRTDISKSESGCSDSVSPLERALASLGRAVAAKEATAAR